MNKTVSVLIPVYNEEKYIRRCLDSLLSQTMTDFEIIVIDDGSTDNTVKILTTYGDPR
ncbi:MAG: glycosyltransferase family 2 protein, partial [Candidatus Electrothrix sp. AX2]|nr:glycosyltransferase family 2 protein [Candidatus Electrothrix gigas]